MKSAEEQKFIAECRSWIGTGWMHNVCLKGYRVDCVHFIVAVSKEMGWLPDNLFIEPYERDWALHRSESKLMAELQKYAYQVTDIQIGDYLVYKYGLTNSHIAFYLGDNKAIHSHIQYGVVEFETDDLEARRHFASAWRRKS